MIKSKTPPRVCKKSNTIEIFFITPAPRDAKRRKETYLEGTKSMIDAEKRYTSEICCFLKNILPIIFLLEFVMSTHYISQTLQSFTINLGLMSVMSHLDLFYFSFLFRPKSQIQMAQSSI
jgi:hypothetical protein